MELLISKDWVLSSFYFYFVAVENTLHLGKANELYSQPGLSGAQKGTQCLIVLLRVSIWVYYERTSSVIVEGVMHLARRVYHASDLLF